RVVGHLAQTRTTLIFGNPPGRALAGDLYFPLPEGVTVSGYALDVQGELVDASVVEKHEGRQVFEKIVRPGIDPGLLEWVAGNTFRTRVFPIPPHGSRTVRLDYVGPLVEGAEGAAYHLPLDFAQPVKELALRVEVVRSQEAPRVRQGGPGNFAFARWRDAWVAEAVLHDTALTEDLVVALPEGQEQRQVVEQAADGEWYFALFDQPPEPQRAETAPLRHLAVLWDASGSRAGHSHDREIGLLDACLARHAAGEVRVDLILFRHRMEPAQRFAARQGACPELLEALREVAYDGGTQLGELPGPAAAEPPDRYLLFSDGLSTFGGGAPGDFGAPVWVISAAPNADHALLRRVAERSGGQYLQLALLTDEQALRSLDERASGRVRTVSNDAEVADLLVGRTPSGQGSVSLAGRLLAPQAQVEVEYLPGDQVAHRARFQVSRADAAQGEMLRRFWAQRKAEELAAEPAQMRAELVALGKRHGLVTPGTSLIVLERLDQYVAHRIPPPASRAALRAEYEERIALRDKEEKESQEERLQEVLALWRERVEWWEKEFGYPKDFRYEGSQEDPTGNGSGEVEMVEAPSPLRRLLGATLTSVGTGGERSEAAGEEQKASGGAPAGGDAEGQAPAIAIEPWNPDTPYLKALRGAPAGQRFSVYLEQRREHGAAPAFYLDCADLFFREGEPEAGLQVLSNVAELELESAPLLRVLAHRLAQLDSLDLSADLFARVLGLRPEEPQSARDLALVLARRAQASAALAAGGTPSRPAAGAVRAGLAAAGSAPPQTPAAQDFRRAIELLNLVVVHPWDRFAEIQVVALMELNRLLPLARAAGLPDLPVDRRLVRLLDVDLRIVLTWDADLTDMDLWVVEPSGERAYYGHRLTTVGGHVSRDFTDGYGPEEYCLRRAPHGEYRIRANYFGSRAPTLSGAVTLQAEVFTDYGRPGEQRRAITLRLEEKRETVDVGVVEF
ncbi:MAG: VIT domain-containing protein, partial [Candidatus Latescibacterota bacterium]